MPYLFLILAILAAEYLLNLTSRVLNVLHATLALPQEFVGWYDGESYRRSQRYLREHARATTMEESIGLPILTGFIVLGGFPLVDRWARGCGGGELVRGLVFTALLLVGNYLLSLPFSLHRTFGIEARYGFNRTTVGTWLLDQLKGGLLVVAIGGPLYLALLWFFTHGGNLAWLWSWVVVSVVQVLLVLVAPVVIMPLFNKFEALPEGALRSALEGYARTHNFALRGIFTMDGSRRSSRGNAFFTGFGRTRRIVLLDTLVEKHPVDELVAVLAHEMGHYRKGHILISMGVSVLTMGVMFFLLSLFITSPALAAAFGLTQPTVYGGLVFFGFLFAPIQLVLSLFGNALSRRHEFQADRFAVESTGMPEALVSGLKRLSVDNLSNLTPHPLTVALRYGHPPILQRIAAIRAVETEQE